LESSKADVEAVAGMLYLGFHGKLHGYDPTQSPLFSLLGYRLPLGHADELPEAEALLTVVNGNKRIAIAAAAVLFGECCKNQCDRVNRLVTKLRIDSELAWRIEETVFFAQPATFLESA
jgi:hypothetical protein